MFHLYLSRHLSQLTVKGFKFTFQSVIKTVSKSNNSYFTITPLTNIVPILHHVERETVEASDQLCFSLHKTVNNVLDAVVSVERVVSVVLSVGCGGCGSSVLHGHCSYVGCRVTNNLEYSARAVMVIICGDKMLTGKNIISLSVTTATLPCVRCEL